MYPILTYGFPLILVLFEWGVRKIVHADEYIFIGPALAVSGISYLVPLLKPKFIEQPEFTYRSKLDNQLIPFIYLLIILSIFGWAYSCVMTLQENKNDFHGFKIYFLVGFAIYILSLIMVLAKEKV
ncbi:hypothetical protein ABTP12_14790 [Acinetobacter baumannii]|nr:hypothetical protein [Acinetobacter baumannii]HAV5317765.1 hypothetical protein [Acinetobacter baumannii]